MCGGGGGGWEDVGVVGCENGDLRKSGKHLLDKFRHSSLKLTNQNDLKNFTVSKNCCEFVFNKCTDADRTKWRTRRLRRIAFLLFITFI